MSAPTAPAGTLCVYVIEQLNVSSSGLALRAGVVATPDPADSRGFYVDAVSNFSGSTTVRYVWAYTGS